MTPRLARLALVVGLLASTGAARADDARAAASASFREAQAAFARRDYAAAAAAFEMTARTAPHAATWLNAAEAWELRGDHVRAAEDCDHALEVPDAPPALRREAELRLDSNVRHVFTLEIRGPGGFGVRIDEGPLAPLPVVRRLAPGAHRVVVAQLADGRETAHAIDGAPGAHQTIDVPAPAPPRAAPPAGRSGPPRAAWIAFGTSAALGIASGVVGALTLGAKADYDDDPTRAHLDAFHRDRLVTNVLLGGAVVAAAVGAGLWLLAPRERTAHAARALLRF